MRTIQYGTSADQQADLHLPSRPRPPVVCLLHGGFWRMPYGRDQMNGLAADLVAHGFAVWNIEYRRLGAPGGGWPGTLEDVGAAIDHLARLVVPGPGLDLDLSRVATVGHSAGGHLALWAAARGRRRAVAVAVNAAAGLAPIADLEKAYAQRLGGEAVAELLGGTPAERREQLEEASPAAQLPLGVPQLVLHGSEDEAVPVELSRRYAGSAKQAGDTIDFVELPGVGHMEFLDPASPAQALLRDWLAATLQP